ncbi:hypothetical protein GSI_10741 [Ganoderma sinense ZZ0214-1]|uniref:Uncharacterized protein n=1 Tax=Ganoderma sinense ZZ0214-1 TaxID=1077348 RepID=A0A2G8S1D9_9APHY|nr:hypothetical protein GSI_10741 [Ganoderma sinense ZZ0214-1]
MATRRLRPRVATPSSSHSEWTAWFWAWAMCRCFRRLWIEYWRFGGTSRRARSSSPSSSSSDSYGDASSRCTSGTRLPSCHCMSAQASSSMCVEARDGTRSPNVGRDPRRPLPWRSLRSPRREPPPLPGNRSPARDVERDPGADLHMTCAVFTVPGASWGRWR